VYVLGSLFLLLSILAMSSIMGTTDFDTLYKGNFSYSTQLFLFYGIFIAFAVKTPTIFLNTWLLKAHVESPLGGSIILAGIVLKLSLYGILRLILPVLPKASLEYTYIVYLIGVITIIYASLSTLRTIDVKELIAYSSVSHAAVYLLGVFSNNIQGIEGGIALGLAHGFVSPGLFICAGGVLYDRSSTRIISFYRGMAQIMPLFAILFFILSLGNCGAPLTLNFVGEYMSLYGVFERLSLMGAFASSSIVFSAAYTIYMYNRISFAGSYSRLFTVNIPDLIKREFSILLILVIFTVVFGIYVAPILDALHYSVSTLLYNCDSNVIYCDASIAWEHYFQNNTSQYMGVILISPVLFIVSLIYVKNNFDFIRYKINYLCIKSNVYSLINLIEVILRKWSIIYTICLLTIVLINMLPHLLHFMSLVGAVFFYFLENQLYLDCEYNDFVFCMQADQSNMTVLCMQSDEGNDAGNGASSSDNGASSSDNGGGSTNNGGGSTNNGGGSTNNGGGSTNNGGGFSGPGDNPVDCEHRSRNRIILASDEDQANNPIPCSFCSRNALDGPLQEAIYCQACGTVICQECNAPNSDSENDSGIGEE
jgi:formate hydrogenlyase subunit 3/multisubunit Na+/H+ antiporter MnhD subunit